jgi:hypothetical protein
MLRGLLWFGPFTREPARPAPGGPVVAALTAVLMLIACDSCGPTAEPVGVDVPAPADGGDACRFGAATSLAGGFGAGPVVATAQDGELLVLAGGRPEGDGQLQLLRYGLDLQPLGTAVTLAVEEAGSLLPEALAVDRRTVVAVARQRSGRRAYVLSSTDGGPFQAVEPPQISSLDRRAIVVLIEPQAGGGIQMVSHLSGQAEVEVGRLAGELAVTRRLHVPPALVGPVATSTASGGLALLAVEPTAAEGRVARLRLVAADAAPERDVVITEVSEGERIVSLEAGHGGHRYWTIWLTRSGGVTRLESAWVDAESLGIFRLPAIQPTTPEATIAAFSATARPSGGVLVAWSERLDGRSRLVYAAVGADGTVDEPRVAAQVEGGRAAEPSLVDVEGQLVLLWREVPFEAEAGSLQAALFGCLEELDGR